MADLEKQLQGVEPESPTGDDDADLDLELEDEPVEGEDPEKKPKRTINNLRRELLRKIDKQSAVVESIMKRLDEISTRPAPAKERTLDDMSLEELRAAKQHVPEENRPQFDEYYQTRLVRETADKRIEEVTTRQTFEQRRRSSVARAKSRYPDLNKEGSDFYQEVDKRLADRGDQYFRTNPTAILDVANEVALDMGVAPRRTVPPGSTATRANTAPARKDEPEFDEAEHDKIVRKLAHAMPKGKTFDKEKIKQGKKMYRDYREYLRPGGLSNG